MKEQILSILIIMLFNIDIKQVVLIL
jgi:hypothetical protein